MEKLPYKNEVEREEIIQKKIKEGKVLVEEGNISTGNYLVFGSEDEIKPTVEERLRMLEDKTETLNTAIIEVHNRLAELETK